METCDGYIGTQLMLLLFPMVGKGLMPVTVPPHCTCEFSEVGVMSDVVSTEVQCQQQSLVIEVLEWFVIFQFQERRKTTVAKHYLTS